MWMKNESDVYSPKKTEETARSWISKTFSSCVGKFYSFKIIILIVYCYVKSNANALKRQIGK